MRTHSWYLEGARLVIWRWALVIITNVHSPVVLFLSSCHALHPQRALWDTWDKWQAHLSGPGSTGTQDNAWYGGHLVLYVLNEWMQISAGCLGSSRSGYSVFSPRGYFCFFLIYRQDCAPQPAFQRLCAHIAKTWDQNPAFAYGHVPISARACLEPHFPEKNNNTQS